MVNTIEWEQGWDVVWKNITKLTKILEGQPEEPFNKEEYMVLYKTLYNMCTQKPHNYCQQLYENYRQVLPSLREKHDEFMLRELVERWENHKVYQEVHAEVKDVVIDLIYREREGELIDRALLNNVLSIFVEVGMGQMDRYEDDFEVYMLHNTSTYYSRKASSWIEEGSCPDYLLKASQSEECLKKERDRVSHYLHSSSETKLTEKVQNELLVAYANRLFENVHSGCRALLRDDKVLMWLYLLCRWDLSRMFRLYCKIPRGLDPVANIFKQHVIDEGTSLVQQAKDATNNQASNAPGVQEQVNIPTFTAMDSLGVAIDLNNLCWCYHQVLSRIIIELHYKYMAYVTDCFQYHSLFYEALKEVFEVFCNKTVNGSSSAELLATFCYNVLKKGGNEKLSDEDIEEILEKVVKLVDYISDKVLFAELYRRKLARQLLFDRSANDDHEGSIPTKLKQQCGGLFTSKLEGMVTDLKLARENQTSFEDYLRSNSAAHPGIDLTVTVLTKGFWPSYKSFDLNLPAEMVPLLPVDEGKEVVEDGRYAIDAALVRITKSRKVLEHQQLVSFRVC
ncbi:hypothetical protein GQ457_15G021860 [Hibiscus cannabinus]